MDGQKEWELTVPMQFAISSFSYGNNIISQCRTDNSQWMNLSCR